MEAPNSFSHSQAMHFSLGHIFPKLVYCRHTYACVDSFEYQVIHDMNYNDGLICWKVLFLAGPCIVELASIHNSLESDERRKWVQRTINPWNNLNVKPIFFSLVMCACFHLEILKKLDIEVADLTEFTEGEAYKYVIKVWRGEWESSRISIYTSTRFLSLKTEFILHILIVEWSKYFWKLLG